MSDGFSNSAQVIRLSRLLKECLIDQIVKLNFRFIFQRWEVFRNVSELIIMVPALIGLKGNLDMCLASRLSTQANLGNMLNFKNMVSMVIGNICLVQIQAIVASFIVALFAIAVNAAINGNSTLETSIMVIAAAMFTATTSCLVLGKSFV